MEGTIDGTVNDVRQRWPLLSDETFCKAFPGIERVASFLHAESSGPAENIPAFERSGIADIDDYLVKLKKNDPAAKRIYRSVKNALQS
jgi:hypothetical protein